MQVLSVAICSSELNDIWRKYTYKRKCLQILKWLGNAYRIYFTEIHRSSLRKTEYILNRAITKFYNSDDVNATTAELRQAKTRPISLSMIDNLLYEIKVPGGDKL